MHRSQYPYQSTLHPTPPSPSIPPLTLSSPHFFTKNHATNTAQPCESTTTNPPKQRRTMKSSGHAPQLISLSIYSTSYTSFPVCFSYTNIKFHIFHLKFSPPCLESSVNLHLNDLPAKAKALDPPPRIHIPHAYQCTHIDASPSFAIQPLIPIYLVAHVAAVPGVVAAGRRG